MRRKLKLALVAGSLATMAIPAAPAQASICRSDPEVICTAYYLTAAVLCKVTKGQNCMT